MMSTVVGGTMLPHAPRFFLVPETEDKVLVAHMRGIGADFGQRLRALDPQRSDFCDV